MWVVADAWPFWICFTLSSARLIGIAKPEKPEPPELPLSPQSPYEGSKVLPPAAVLIPITRPFASASAPPESPGWSCASVSIIPIRRSESEPPSLAVIELPSRTMLPRAALGVPPAPPAFPTATTASPTRTLRRVAELGGLEPGRVLQLQHREVRGDVVADDGGGVRAAVPDVGGADRGGAADDVVVRDDGAVRGDDDPGPGRRRALVGEVRVDVDERRHDDRRGVARGRARAARERGDEQPGRGGDREGGEYEVPAAERSGHRLHHRRSG